MRNARDTFLRFLADNLPSLTVNAIRRDMNDPNSDTLQNNAINIKFLSPTYDNQIAEQPVSIDILNDNELTALDWATQVWNLMSTRFYTPIYDYTTVATPVNTGYVLFWNRKMRFSEIQAPYYSHLNCTITLNHHLV
jgi:hypothetical protein